MNGNAFLTLILYRRAKQKGLSGSQALKTAVVGQGLGGADAATAFLVSDSLIDRQARRLRPAGPAVKPPPYCFTPKEDSFTPKGIRRELSGLGKAMASAANKEAKEEVQDFFKKVLGCVEKGDASRARSAPARKAE